MNKRESLLAFPRRRWWMRRVFDRSTWFYFFGDRLIIFRYRSRDGKQTLMVAVYIATKRLNVTWRPYGGF